MKVLVSMRVTVDAEQRDSPGCCARRLASAGRDVTL